MTLSCIKVPDLSCRFGMMLRYGPKRVIFSGLHSTNQPPVAKERTVSRHTFKECNHPCIFYPVDYKSSFLKLNSKLQTTCQSASLPNVDFFQQENQIRIQSLLENRKQRDNHISMINTWSQTPFIDNQHIAFISLQRDKALYQWEKLLVPEKRLDVSKDKSKCIVKRSTIEERHSFQEKLSQEYHKPHFTDINKNSSVFCGYSKDIFSFDKRNELDKDKDVLLFKGSNKPPNPSPNKGKSSPNNRATPTQLAQVLLTLREELPWFFYGGHRYDIYHKDVVFANGLISNRQTRGLWLYRLQMKLMRWAALIGYSQVTLNIIKITKHDTECTIRIRWQVEGLPRYRIFAQWLPIKISHNQLSYIDAISTLEVGSQGKVVFHAIEKLMRGKDAQTTSKFAVSAASVMGAVQAIKPTSILPGIVETNVSCLESKVGEQKDIPTVMWDNPSLMD